MSGILLTQNSTFIIGPIAKLLGYLMEGIFYVLSIVGIPNIGLAIIFFTIVIYLLLTPLTYKQQKFSKLQAKMSPEIQAIQAKYKGKKDNDSMMLQNQEIQAVYAKYGVSQTGSCVQLLIQMPILFALYRVIYAIPAYVGQVKDAFFPLVDKLIAQKGSADFIKNFSGANFFSKQFTNENFINNVGDYVSNTYIDVLNRASTADWLSIKSQYSALSADVDQTLGLLNKYNNFLGLNIANSPWYTIKDGISSGRFLIVIAAIMIPVLAAFTQWLNVKLMPQMGNTGNEQADNMANQMKTMNMMMPLMSAWFCVTLPAGMGIYWIAGAVIRSIQQILINKHIDKIDFSIVIEKNKEKAEKLKAKQAKQMDRMQQYATASTRNLKPGTSSVTEEEREAALARTYGSTPKAGSMAEKANLVRSYNEKNNKKNETK